MYYEYREKEGHKGVIVTGTILKIFVLVSIVLLSTKKVASSLSISKCSVFVPLSVYMSPHIGHGYRIKVWKASK